MNSSKIELVFVNPDEEYYSVGISNMNTKKYLWLYFHRRGYENVYFLSCNQTQLLINDYGDKNSLHFVRDGIVKRTLKIAADSAKNYVNDPSPNEFKNVLLPELDKTDSAIVISAEAFCELAKLKEFNSAVSTFIKRKRSRSRFFIIINAEEDRIILDERIRQYIDSKLIIKVDDNKTTDEQSVRDQFLISDNENCIFLDRITKDDSKNILLNIMMTNRFIFESGESIVQLNDYLSLVTDELVPIDLDFGVSYRFKSRRDCHDYLMSDKGWQRLVSNSKHLSREELMLPYCSEDMLNYTVSYGDNNSTLRELVDEYRKHLNDCLDRGLVKNPDNSYLAYCIMKLSQLLNSRRYADDYYTTGIIILSMNWVFLGFMDVEKIDHSKKRRVPREFLDSFLDCFEDLHNVVNDRRLLEEDKSRGFSFNQSSLSQKNHEKIEKKINESSARVKRRLADLYEESKSLRLNVTNELGRPLVSADALLDIDI